MWCQHCHQDVPAIASETRGAAVCARCQRELRFTVAKKIVDSGVSLEAVSPTVVSEARHDGFDPLGHIESRENLRRIGRQLRAACSETINIDVAPAWERLLDKRLPASALDEATALRIVAKNASNEPAHHESRQQLLSFLLACGGVGFLAGVASLAWSAAFGRVAVWQWGLTTTLVSEGILILGLTWMAARLWTNSRRINRELRGVDEQLDEIHELAGSLAASRLSASQHYYQHFSQVANPHMLVANLRGQIDQLAERIAG